MRYFYPTEQQAIFTDREKELSELAFRCDQFRAGRQAHASLFGLRRIGKTLLLKEFIRRLLEVPVEAGEPPIVPVYMDFAALCSAPEDFVAGYVGWICYWTLHQGEVNPALYLTADSLITELLRLGSSELSGSVAPILTSLRNTRPDRAALLRQAFELPEVLAHQRNVLYLLILDEFQELEALSHFQGTKNIVGIFRSVMQTQGRVLYILAGSAIGAMTRLITDPQSPLFVHFSQIPVPPFQRAATAELAARLLHTDPPDEVIDELQRLTGGHPFYLTVLCEHLHTTTTLQNRPVDPLAVRVAFITETLSSTGRIQAFCRYLYDLSLQKARGYGSLKATLSALAREEPLTASEVARLLRVTPGSARDYLLWLSEVDMVTEKEKRYRFRDPVMRYWVFYATRGISVGREAMPEDLAELLNGLDTFFERTGGEG